MDAEAPELRALASYYGARGGGLWVAGDADGMVAAVPSVGGAWEICRVYVHPRLHGSGLGAALMDAAERHAVREGARELVLWTDTRFTRARRFYEGRSYVRTGPSRALHDIGNTLEYRYAKPVEGVWALDGAGAHSAERRLSLVTDEPEAYWQEMTRLVVLGQAALLATWRDAVLVGASLAQDAALAADAPAG